jgi:hypothetical protein
MFIWLEYQLSRQVLVTQGCKLHKKNTFNIGYLITLFKIYAHTMEEHIFSVFSNMVLSWPRTFVLAWLTWLT